MDENLFDDKNNAGTETPTTFKIGDQEYTQEQIDEAFSKASLLDDVESKFSTKIDKVVPDYTRATQETAELRKRLAEIENQQLQQKAQQGQLSQEELIARAKMEAQNIGIMTDENTPQMVHAAIEGYDLRRETEGLVGELEDMGISADPKVIMRYMDSAELDDPEDAVRELYGRQIELWQEAELEKEKAGGLTTFSGGNGGASRMPTVEKITDDNLQSEIEGMLA